MNRGQPWQNVRAKIIPERSHASLSKKLAKNPSNANAGRLWQFSKGDSTAKGSVK
jgi:hypothetical protein